MTAIEQSTGFLVVRTARCMKKALDAELARYGITSSQHTVLSALNAQDGMPLSEVGRQVYLDKPAITGLADRLEKDGLVERKRTIRDRRVVRLFLTAKGRRILATLDTIAAQVDRQLVRDLTDGELARLRRMLDRIWTSANGEAP